MSVKVQVIFYSMYGHIHRMAEAVTAGAREVEGAEVNLYQVPELMPPEALERSGAAAARQAFANRPGASQAAVSRVRTNWPSPATRAGTWPRSPRLSSGDAKLNRDGWPFR